MRVSIGCDHAGFPLKAQVLALLDELEYDAVDHGTDSEESVDYPDFAAPVCQDVRTGRAGRGILICGTGIGMSIAANKFPGIRAAAPYDEKTARMSRTHNDTNVLALGARTLSPAVAVALARIWLSTPAEGGRHARRVAEISAIENAVGASD